MIRRQAMLKKSEDTYGWKSLELAGQQPRDGPRPAALALA